MSAAFVTRVRRWGTVLILLVLACLFLPATAQAGGPTSAMLVSPANQQAAALYYSDPEYEQLMMLVDEPAAVTSTNPASTNPAPSVSADYVTVTWLIHDVTVWRIDRIFLTGPEGEPWIVTQTENGDPAAAGVPLAAGMYPGEHGTESASWHRSTDPAALTALLTNLGLFSAGENAAVSDSAAVSESAAAPMTAAVDVDPSARAGGVWWWAIGGLLIGGALMVLVVRYLPAARRRLVGDGIDKDSTGQTRRMVEIPG